MKKNQSYNKQQKRDDWRLTLRKSECSRDILVTLLRQNGWEQSRGVWKTLTLDTNIQSPMCLIFTDHSHLVVSSPQMGDVYEISLHNDGAKYSGKVYMFMKNRMTQYLKWTTLPPKTNN